MPFIPFGFVRSFLLLSVFPRWRKWLGDPMYRSSMTPAISFRELTGALPAFLLYPRWVSSLRMLPGVDDLLFASACHRFQD